MYENQALVLDNGSGFCKVGFASDEAPKSSFSSVVGKPRNPSIIIGTEQKDSYVGDEAQMRRGVLNMSYPISRGIVQNWEDMERVWAHAFNNELRTATDDHPVFITEASLNPKSNREKMTQIMFEKFNISSFYVGNQSVLSLYSIGKMSGLVLYSGDGVTHADPILEGYAIPQAIQRLDLGGRDITEILSRLLLNRGINLTSSAEKEIVRNIKEKHCNVSCKFDEDMEGLNSNVEYTLPDDNVIKIGKEVFAATEVMFNSGLFGMELPSVDQIVCKSVWATDLDFRKYLLENIVLSGGNTMYPGFMERLTIELNKRVSEMKYDKISVKVRGSPERRFSTWIGAAMLSGLTSFQSMWLTKSEYEEHGPHVIHSKCIS